MCVFSMQLQEEKKQSQAEVSIASHSEREAIQDCIRRCLGSFINALLGGVRLAGEELAKGIGQANIVTAPYMNGT